MAICSDFAIPGTFSAEFYRMSDSICSTHQQLVDQAEQVLKRIVELTTFQLSLFQRRIYGFAASPAAGKAAGLALLQSNQFPGFRYN